ncbi:MAG: hypothetical protein RR483_01055 [Clostridia bacterium]
MRHSTTKNIISAFVFGAAMAAGAYYACKLLCSSEKFNTAKRNFEKMMKDKINSVAVVTHPGIIMYIISAMGIPKVDFKKNLIGPGTGFTLFASPQLWMQSGALEVYSHLPYELEKQQEENN